MRWYFQIANAACTCAIDDYLDCRAYIVVYSKDSVPQRICNGVAQGLPRDAAIHGIEPLSLGEDNADVMSDDTDVDTGLAAHDELVPQDKQSRVELKPDQLAPLLTLTDRAPAETKTPCISVCSSDSDCSDVELFPPQQNIVMPIASEDVRITEKWQVTIVPRQYPYLELVRIVSMGTVFLHERLVFVAVFIKIRYAPLSRYHFRFLVCCRFGSCSTSTRQLNSQQQCRLCLHLKIDTTAAIVSGASRVQATVTLLTPHASQPWTSEQN
jgi:hypothetical protein